MEVLEGEALEEHIRSFLSDLTDVLQKVVFAAAEAFDRLEDGTHRSLLFRSLAYSPADYTKTERLSQRELAARRLTEAGVLPVE